MNATARIAPPEERLMVSTLVAWDCGVEISEEEEEEAVETGGFQVLLVSVMRVAMDWLAGTGARRRATFVGSDSELATGCVPDRSVLEVSWGAIWETDTGDSGGIRGNSFGPCCSTSSAGCVASFGASGIGVVSILPAITVEETVMVTGGISSLGGVQ